MPSTSMADDASACATATAHTKHAQDVIREIYVRSVVSNRPPSSGAGGEGLFVRIKLRDATGDALGTVDVPLDKKDTSTSRGWELVRWPLVLSLTALCRLKPDQSIDVKGGLTKTQRLRYFGELQENVKIAKIELDDHSDFVGTLTGIVKATLECSRAKTAAYSAARAAAAGEVRVP